MGDNVSLDNGGFGPTSRGHSSAPNKKMQLALSKFLPVIVGSEYRSSQTSACHHVQVKKQKTLNYTCRHTVVTCKACHTMLGRDANAAHVIADIFQDMSVSFELPLWITDNGVRTGFQIVGATFD